MKKIILVAILFCGFTFLSNAQVMKKGDKALNIGIGVPSVYGTLRIPAVIGAFDVGVTDKLGIGYISAGGYVAVSGGKQWKGFIDEKNSTNFIIGARAAYHFDFVDITGNSSFDKLDIYAGFIAGAKITAYHYVNDYSTDYTNVGFANDVFVGIRYNFAPAMAVYAEAGYGVAYLSAGISFRM